MKTNAKLLVAVALLIQSMQVHGESLIDRSLEFSAILDRILDVAYTMNLDPNADSPYRMTHAEMAAEIMAAYDSSFPSIAPNELENWPIEQVRALFDATHQTIVFTSNSGLGLEHDEALIRRLEQLYDHLVGHDATTERVTRMVTESYTRARAFQRMEEFLDCCPELAANMPDFIDSLAASTTFPTYWAFNAEENVLKRKRAEVSEGQRIVAIGSAHCGFARQAAVELADSDLFSTVQPLLIWIAPPSDLLGLDELLAWNARHPEMQLGLLHRVEGWDFLEELRDSPSFYFLRDGQVEARLFGWPDRLDDYLAEWHEALRAIGVDL